MLGVILILPSIIVGISVIITSFGGADDFFRTTFWLDYGLPTSTVPILIAFMALAGVLLFYVALKTFLVLEKSDIISHIKDIELKNE